MNTEIIENSTNHQNNTINSTLISTNQMNSLTTSINNSINMTSIIQSKLEDLNDIKNNYLTNKNIDEILTLPKSYRFTFRNRDFYSLIVTVSNFIDSSTNISNDIEEQGDKLKEIMTNKFYGQTLASQCIRCLF